VSSNTLPTAQFYVEDLVAASFVVETRSFHLLIGAGALLLIITVVGDMIRTRRHPGLAPKAPS
jgi:hypothetical protein